MLRSEAVVADLFDERDRTRDAALLRTIDKIRDKSGRNAILLTTQQPTSKDQAAQVYKSEHQSPRYTTGCPVLTRKDFDLLNRKMSGYNNFLIRIIR